MTTRISRPDRRRFLATTGAGLALPFLRSPTTPRSPGARIGLGLIGIGIRGRNMMTRSFLADDGFRVVAVCDVDTKRREDAKRRVDARYGNSDCAAFIDYQDLLAREDIDAVVIATPDHWHANQIIDACKAGKDVYCEKPLTLTLREAKKVIEAVRKTDRVFQTGSQQRTEFGQKFVRASEAIRNGRLGRVHNVNVGVGRPPVPCQLPAEDVEPGLDWDRWLGPAPERPYNAILSPRGIHRHYPKWRDYVEYAGGGLADMGAHHFDIAQWALSMDTSGPVRVVPPREPGAITGAWVEYAGGTKVIHGGISGCTFVGDKGVLHVDRGRIDSVPEKILKEALPDDAERLPRRKSHATDWLECIRERKRPICDVEVGARSVAVCHLLNLAYRLRRPLTWDPERWCFLEEDADTWLDYERRDGYELPSV